MAADIASLLRNNEFVGSNNATRPDVAGTPEPSSAPTPASDPESVADSLAPSFTLLMFLFSMLAVLL